MNVSQMTARSVDSVGNNSTILLCFVPLEPTIDPGFSCESRLPLFVHTRDGCLSGALYGNWMMSMQAAASIHAVRNPLKADSTVIGRTPGDCRPPQSKFGPATRLARIGSDKMVRCFRLESDGFQSHVVSNRRPIVWQR